MILPEDEETVQIMGCLEIPMPEFIGCRGGMGDISPLTNRWLRCRFAKKANQNQDNFCWCNNQQENPYDGEWSEGRCLLTPEENDREIIEELSIADYCNKESAEFRLDWATKIAQRWPNNERIQRALKQSAQKVLQCK